MNKDHTGKFPVHALTKDAHPYAVNDLAYRNPYDFHTPHRHTYYEIFLIEKGGGSQIIDFVDLPLKDNSCYVVFPQQIHHVKRDPSSTGIILQFNEQILPASVINNITVCLLQLRKSSVVFENNNEKFQQLKEAFAQSVFKKEEESKFQNDVALLMLQLMLYKVMDLSETVKDSEAAQDYGIIERFLILLDEEFRENHLVSKYLSEMNISERKLGDATKKHLGLTPLQVIHNRILLEAKRMLSLKVESHKEIAFSLGFESAAAFSAFIRSKTNLTPTELQKELSEIHK